MFPRAEAIATGSLAGANAARCLAKKALLILPKESCIGDIISYANYRLLKKNDKKSRYTFAGSIYFTRMKELGMYTTNIEEIKERIDRLELTDIFKQKLL
ncbi:hypothetical protein HAHI6034_11750 [Hathewaya histolytica]|uniref:Glucose-inhibited division protein A n=1 Tax=Hathewaya histolytica TaxID=1498 RepID=A0A4U9RD98_HATHI|nr:hypothetical protein [Hathewaya histolytica]VTQ88931.1 glucose-inhibited division protein A [Hathewaya histolytica]